MRRRLGVLLVALLLGACSDGGPEGPGTLDVRVRSSLPAGAVLLEVEGRGIEGVTPRGSVRAFHEQVGTDPDGDEVHRVLLVAETPGDMEVGLRVEDVGATRPRVVVLSASDAAYQPVASVSGFAVHVLR